MAFTDLQKAFDLFSKMMNEDKVYLDASLTYDAICRRIGIAPADLDEKLMAELGMDGETILYRYRQ